MSENKLDLIASSRKKLERGFYADNLNELADLFRELALLNVWPSACFVLRHVSLAIAQDWDDHAVTTSEADQVEKQLRPLIFAVLNLVEQNASVEAVTSGLDRLVLGLFNLKV